MLNINKDNWLSVQFDRLVYNVNISKLNENTFQKEWSKFGDTHICHDYFVYSKVNTDEVVSWQALERAGFNLIDTSVQFEKYTDFSISKTWNINIKISVADIEHRIDLLEIAHNNFVYSRFHVDPQIDNEIANRIKKNWVHNFILGHRGNQMIVTSINNKPVGFLLLIIKNEEVVIDLICVEKIFQGKGIASAMIQYAFQNLGNKKFHVGTQIRNLPSIRLYQNLGFKLSGSYYTFHYHHNV